jgi:hypothetical protein
VYFASDKFLIKNPVQQRDEERERQASFAKRIKDSGKHWAAFDSIDQLCRLVLRDGWQMEDRPCQPPAEPEPPPFIALREALTAPPGIVPNLDERALQTILRHQPRTLSAYRVARVAEWSQRRYELDKSFTRLTLLLDQGPDAEGARWQAQPRSFRDLRDVFAEAPEPAVVVLRPPGCGSRLRAASPGAASRAGRVACSFMTSGPTPGSPWLSPAIGPKLVPRCRPTGDRGGRLSRGPTIE